MSVAVTEEPWRELEDPAPRGSVFSEDVALSSAAVRVYRGVVVCVWLGILWKLRYFAELPTIYQLRPLADAFFPAWARSSHILVAAYVTVAVSCGSVFFTRRKSHLFIQAGAATGGLWLLLIHQGSYNDVTFLTAFWASVWCLWFLHRAGVDDDATLFRKAAWLANLILAMILLAGAVGKWTAEYWSGQVLFEIYFRDRDFWLFNFLRALLAEPELRQLACWYSRLVICTETLAFVGLWILPRRWGALLATGVFVAIALCSNLLLFSVVLGPIGLASVGVREFFETPAESAGQAATAA
jgi:hypothetical protein